MNKKLKRLIKERKDLSFKEFSWLFNEENINSINNYINEFIDINNDYKNVYELHTRLKRNNILFNKIKFLSSFPKLSEKNKIIYEGFLDQNNIIKNRDFFTKKENIKYLALSLSNKSLNDVKKVLEMLNLENSNFIFWYYLTGITEKISLDEIFLTNPTIELNKHFFYSITYNHRLTNKQKEKIKNFIIKDVDESYFILCEKKENHPFLKELLSHSEINKKINKKDKMGWNALLYATHCGCLDIVKYLLSSPDLKKHANIHDKENQGWNALLLAVSNGDLEIVKYLLASPDLKEHANINSNINNDWNALLIGVSSGNLEIVKYLLASSELKEHADINSKTKDGKDALLIASEEGNLEIVKYLLTSPELKNHSDINIKDKNGYTVLMNAVRSQNLTLIEYLLSSPELKEHAKINEKNKYGYDALLIASQSNNIDIIKYLIEGSNLKEHANINTQTKGGWNVLLVAIHNKQLEVVKYILLYLLKDKDFITEDIKEKLFILIENYKEESCQEFINFLYKSKELNKKISLNIKNKNKNTILMWAYRYNKIDIKYFKKLLGSDELKEKLEITNKNLLGENLLAIAINKESVEGVKYFYSFPEIVKSLNVRSLNYCNLLAGIDEKTIWKLITKLKKEKHSELNCFINRIRENEISNNFNLLNKKIESLNIQYRGINLNNYIYKLSSICSLNVFAEKIKKLKVTNNLLKFDIENLPIEYFNIIVNNYEKDNLLNLYEKLVNKYYEDDRILNYLEILDSKINNDVKANFLYNEIFNIHSSKNGFSVYLEKIANLLNRSEIILFKEQIEDIKNNNEISSLFSNYMLRVSLIDSLKTNDIKKNIIKI